MRKIYFAPQIKVVILPKQILLAGTVESDQNDSFNEEENVG